MKRKLVIIFILIFAMNFALAVNGSAGQVQAENQSNEDNHSTGLIVPDEVRAYWIAVEECSDVGEISEDGTYNENSKTWWFNIAPFEEQKGCNPACVVDLSDETAEVNWRCTGLGCRDNSDCEENEICGNGGQCINVKKVLNQSQIAEITGTKNRLEAPGSQSECPENCTCSGSTTKCQLQNATRVMTVHAGSSGNTIVQVKNTNMSTSVTLYKSEGKVYAVFRNNETREIILSDEVRERIQERLRQRSCSCENITLNEDGEYYVQARKRARLFWLIPVREKVRTRLDAETGEIIRIRNPWWGFLARDVRDIPEESE